MATAISWTDETWNPATGCSKVSEGCRFCYAERLSLEKGWSSKPWVKAHQSDNVKEHPDRLRKPFGLKTPSRIFVNSMSDLFHPSISDSFRHQIFDTIEQCPQHTFQALTKRAEAAKEWTRYPANFWMGVSVEDRRALRRLYLLKETRCHVKFVSFEPLLESLGGVDLSGIDWAIVGGESGREFRPMDHAWAREIRDSAVNYGCAFFFKQSAALRTEVGTALIESDGSKWIWQQFPGHLSPPVKK